MYHSDRECIEAYKKGNNEEAFSGLVRAHMEPTYRFVRAMVRDQDAARDIVQETFVKLWKHVDEFDEEKPLTPWLLQIAKRTAIDWIRKRGREISFSEFERRARVAIADVYGAYDAHDYCARANDYDVQEAIALAPDAYREVMRYKQEGNTFAQIARLTKTSLNTVKSRYRRALIFLRARLDPHQN